MSVGNEQMLEWHEMWLPCGCFVRSHDNEHTWAVVYSDDGCSKMHARGDCGSIPTLGVIAAKRRDRAL